MNRNLSLCLILLIISPLVKAQHSVKEGILILYKPLYYNTRLIRVGDDIAYKTDSVNPSKEIKITGISHDTLFFKDGNISCRSFYAMKFIDFENSKEFLLSKWRIAVPPAEVYQSADMLHSFRFWIVRNKSSDGSYNYQDWLYSKHYHTATVVKMKKEKEKKDYARFMDTIHKNFFKFDLTRFICFQVTYAYEYRFSPVYALEIEAGWQCRNDKPDRPQTDPVPLFPLQGPMFAAGPKIYFHEHKRPFMYFQPQFLYKYTYFNREWDLKEVTHGEAEFQDQHRNVVGLSLNVGSMRSFGVFFIDLTWGVGIKYALISQTLYYHASRPTDDPKQFRYYNASHEPVYRISEAWNPIINFLVKIGVAF